jgi:hypothetical protein
LAAVVWKDNKGMSVDTHDPLALGVICNECGNALKPAVVQN